MAPDGPDAYPISFVTLRRFPGSGGSRVLAVTRAFEQYLTGSRGSAAFRQRGMLLVEDTWPVVPGPRPEPAPTPALQPAP